jgi:glutathione S-transferase
MALAHKGLSAETIPWCFTEKERDRAAWSEKVPVLLDGDARSSIPGPSPTISKTPIRPAVAVRRRGRPRDGADAELVGRRVIGGMFPLIIADIPLNLKPEDAAYFRKSREARFGKPLEEIMASRDKAVEGFRKSLDPLRLTLRTQPFLGGAARTMRTISCSARSSGRG